MMGDVIKDLEMSDKYNWQNFSLDQRDCLMIIANELAELIDVLKKWSK